MVFHHLLVVVDKRLHRSLVLLDATLVLLKANVILRLHPCEGLGGVLRRLDAGVLIHRRLIPRHEQTGGLRGFGGQSLRGLAHWDFQRHLHRRGERHLVVALLVLRLCDAIVHFGGPVLAVVLALVELEAALRTLRPSVGEVHRVGIVQQILEAIPESWPLSQSESVPLVHLFTPR